MPFVGLKYAMHSFLTSTVARTLMPSIVLQLDYEQTLQRAILILVTILALLLGDSTVNRNTLVFIVECFAFHALMITILRLQWPKDNIYLSLKRSDVDLRAKLVLSCSSTPFVLITRILISGSTRRLPVVLLSCKNIILSILGKVIRCVTLLIFGPPRILYAILHGMCSSMLSPVIWITKRSIQLVPVVADSGVKLLTVCLKTSIHTLHITCSSSETLTRLAFQATKSVAMAISESAINNFLQAINAFAGVRGIIDSELSSLGAQAASLLPVVIGRMHYLSGSIFRILEHVIVSIAHVVAVVFLFIMEIAKETAKDAISRLHFLCLVVCQLCRLSYSIANLFIRLLYRLTLPSTAFFLPNPSKAKVLSAIKVFGAAFIVIISVLVLYRFLLEITRRNIENPTLMVRRYVGFSKDQQSRDSQSCTKSDINSLVTPINQRSMSAQSFVEETHMTRKSSIASGFAAAAAPSFTSRGGPSSQSSTAKNSPQRNEKPDDVDLAVPDIRQLTPMQAATEKPLYMKEYSIAAHCAAATAPDFIAMRVLRRYAKKQVSQITMELDICSATTMDDQNQNTKDANEIGDLRKDFSAAVHCAAAVAPKFIACEVLRRISSEVREVYEARITELEAKIHVLEEGASGVLIGPKLVREERNDEEARLRPSYVFYLARGLEAARLDMTIGEKDVQDAAQSWAVDQTRNIYNLQTNVDAQPVFERLYDGDLDLIDFLDLEPTNLCASPLLLPSSSCRGELEAELQAMELIQKVAEHDLDMDIVDIDRKIDKDLGETPQSPSLHARRALLQARSAKREEKRVASMAIRRELIREGMMLLTQGAGARESL